MLSKFTVAFSVCHNCDLVSNVKLYKVFTFGLIFIRLQYEKKLKWEA